VNGRKNLLSQGNLLVDNVQLHAIRVDLLAGVGKLEEVVAKSDL